MFTRRKMRLPASARAFRAAFAKTVYPCLAIAALGCFGASPLPAQQLDSLRQSIGEWRAHLSFAETIDVAAGARFTAWATTGGVVLRYTENGEIRRLDKTNALSQARVRRIACDPERDRRLIVLYEDGAVEVIDDERSVHYVTAVANARVPGRRNINQVRSLGGSRFVVAADFGFLIFDADEGIFLDDVRLPERINDAAVLAGDLYLATDGGVLVLTDYRNRRTLRDVTQYRNLGDVLPRAAGRCFSVVNYKNELYAAFNDRIYAVAPGAGTSRVAVDNGCVDWFDLDAAGDRLVGASRGVCGGVRGRVAITEDGRTFRDVDAECAIAVVGAAVAPGGEVVMAGIGPSYDESALMIAEGTDAPCRQVPLRGPSFSTVFDVVARDGVVAVAAGGSST